MSEKERKTLVKECLKAYYEEDKAILLHSSSLQISCIPYLLYNHIFFGNTIMIPKRTFKIMKRTSKEKPTTVRQEIRVRNATYLLESIQRDTRADYRIISLEQYGKSEPERIKNYLLKNPDTIFYLADLDLFQTIKEAQIVNQLYLLSVGMYEVNPYQSKIYQFQTIGAIHFEQGKMMIHQRGTTLIKIYNAKGIEKQQSVTEVKPRDFVLLRGDKGDAYSFNLYEIVSRHTRNHALRIIWTNLKKGSQSNQYIDRLPYQYKKMIVENID